METVWPRRLALIALVLAVIVITKGGFTRITDSGLGCPDWPGCFGEMVMPTDTERLSYLQERYPEIHVAAHKGWIEMIHRYLATFLGVIIVALAYFGIRYRGVPHYPSKTSLVLLGLVMLQGAFGMWTVTMKLLPIIVTIHLMGGLIILSTLMYLRARLRQAASGVGVGTPAKRWVLGGILVLFMQMALGGWVSTNYAGWACPSLLTCAAGVDVPYDFKAGFEIETEIGPNYEGGQLALEARAAIQMVHRVGAFVVIGYWAALLIWLARRNPSVQSRCQVMAGLLAGQVVLGYANVVYAVPDALAFGHHVLAVLLVIAAWQFVFDTDEQGEVLHGSLGRPQPA